METISTNGSSNETKNKCSSNPPQYQHLTQYQYHYNLQQNHYLANSVSSTTSSSLASSSSTTSSVMGMMMVGPNGDSTENIGSSSSSSQSSQLESLTSVVNPTNLIVNYLPQTMSETELRCLFEQIDFVERCKLIKNKQNQSLCYGFVKYTSPDSAERAISRLNGLKIQNKVIKVSLARPSCESIKGANLYICGIPYHWSTQDLESYFSQCGRIITSRILTSKGQSKGVGFVRFDRRQEAQLAIERLNGRVPIFQMDSDGINISEPLVVRYAKFWTIQDQNMSDILNTSDTTINSNYHMSLGAATYNFKPFQQFSVFNPENVQNVPIIGATAPPLAIAQSSILTHEDAIHSKVASSNCLTPAYFQPGPIAWRICVRNLPAETQETLLWELFGPFGAVLNVRLMRTYTNNMPHKGQACIGYVTMALVDDANKAIQALDGFTYLHRTLQVYLTQNHAEFFC